MGMLNQTFAELASVPRPALVGYLPAGFPDVPTSITACRAMVEAGVDIVEVGVPYSDPVMDGPTIQQAAERSLAGGMRVSDVFDVVRAVAGTGAPTVVMTYWNLVERYGVDRFAAALSQAGGCGLITPDLIPEEAQEWTTAARAHLLDQIFLVAPSSTDSRLALTADASSGFVYATSVMGRSEEHTSELQSRFDLVCRLLLEKKKDMRHQIYI